MDRRQFLKTLTAAGSLVGLSSLINSPSGICQKALSTQIPDQKNKAEKKTSPFVLPARHWEKLDNKLVQCKLCPRGCPVPINQRGFCRVRENQDGEYKTLVYGRPVSMAVDPIEKKPLFHFFPGTLAFSIATAGCNFECKFCQNWEISQASPEQISSDYFSPNELANAASKSNSKTIAYTYSEPTVFYEYMYDCAVEGNNKNIHSVMISNGYMQEKPLRDLAKVLSAIKIDFKAFTEKFYKETCSGELKPVMQTLEILKEEKIWFEIVILIIPTLNDSINENREMCKWIVKNLGADIPIHYSRFHPTYKIKNLPRTPIDTLDNIRNVALEEGCKFVYLGNVAGHEGENTFCPSCKEKLISRVGFYIKENKIQNGECPKCKTKIAGIWSEKDLKKS